MDEIPLYEEGDDINEFLEKVEQYHTKISYNKYNIVLGFINDWFKLNKANSYTSLSEFKYVTENRIPKYNKEVVNKHKDIIKSIFDIKIIDKHGFLYIIRKLLKKIGYKIISKKKYDKKFYMIEKFTVL